ncbi:hypothetical protein [uncultured Bacteroides sp.]|uniref:hypothetical protein n=1 Tax=uncultured Bacteroides sp. TaxID=162156 RepID=UPI002AAABD0E|nr:hypothetical protein [uncultured Bacteroides sp.]
MNQPKKGNEKSYNSSRKAMIKNIPMLSYTTSPSYAQQHGDVFRHKMGMFIKD